jgi:glutathione peroxidase
MIFNIIIEFKKKVVTMVRLFIILTAFINIAWGSDFYSIKEKSIRGEEFKISDLKGKTVLVVNIASQCGFTGQLDDLEALYKKYSSKNFVVLGVPTNDFGSQTPENDKAMLEFCQKNYQVTFPILTKSTIKGKNKRELYTFLTEKSSKDFQGDVGWNFVKFLVSKEGKVIGRFTSYVSPKDKDFIKAIEASL